VAISDALETERKGNEMNNDENWESEIDWSKRTSVVGGERFYAFVKTQAIPVLDEGLKEMAAAKAACEDKMRRWGGICERSQKLAECFTAIVADADFMRMIDDFDARTGEMFKGERIPTLGGWIRLGIRFTAAMRDGSSLPTKFDAELKEVNREIAAATAVRNILRSFVSASDDDYRLRCAPERYRMRVFRDFSKDVNDIADAGARVNLVSMPDFLNGVGEALKVIIEVGNRMQGICRRAKKDIKRHGSAFWSKLDAWNAMRRAV